MRVRQRILIRGVCLALTLGFLAAGQCLLVAGESFAATGPGRTDEDDGALYEEYDEATAAAFWTMSSSSASWPAWFTSSIPR